MPVRRSVTDVAELKKLAELVPEDDLSRVETKGVVPDAGPQNEDVLKYVSMMKQVRALRDSVYACGKSMEDARERLTADVSGEEKDNLSAWIMDQELEQARLQLTREPRRLPTMRINPDVSDLFQFHYEDFSLEDYDPWPHIKAEVSV